MSIDAMTWAFRSGLKPGPRFVLVCLGEHGGDHSGEDWACFPSVERLMDRTGYSRAAVERHLKDLEAEGWLTRKRRRRPDGKLGIYDYVLHRDEATRAALKAERNQTAGEEASGAQPHVNLTHGPCVNLEPAMRQNGAQPYVNLTHHEPSGEPSRGTLERAREPGDEGFEAAFAAYPETGRLRTGLPAARAAFAKAAGEVGAERLIAAVTAYAEGDPDLRKGGHGAPRFEAWLSGERWRVWLTAAERAEAPAWAGPAEVFAAAAAVHGQAWAGSYLGPCGWREDRRLLVARTRIAEQTLERERRAGLFGEAVAGVVFGKELD